MLFYILQAVEQKYREEKYEKVSKRKAFKVEFLEQMANLDLPRTIQ